MKKILVTLMAAILLAVSVTACGGGAESSDSTNDTVQTETAE